MSTSAASPDPASSDPSATPGSDPARGSQHDAASTAGPSSAATGPGRSAARSPGVSRASSDDAAAASDRGHSGSAAVHVRELHKSYGDLEVLRGIDLDVATGEVVCLIGPSGSGKSTLASTIAGHPRYTVDSGSITLDGDDVLAMTVDQRARAGLGARHRQHHDDPPAGPVVVIAVDRWTGWTAGQG